jgi:hypothetical protein
MDGLMINANRCDEKQTAVQVSDSGSWVLFTEINNTEGGNAILKGKEKSLVWNLWWSQ